jgi:Protein of unknown function (DUF2783)
MTHALNPAGTADAGAGASGSPPVAHLITEPNIDRPDDFYEALIDMHRDLTEAQSQLVNAKLILLLGNQIGDLGILREAMALARDGVLAGDEAADAGQRDR